MAGRWARSRGRQARGRVRGWIGGCAGATLDSVARGAPVAARLVGRVPCNQLLWRPPLQHAGLLALACLPACLRLTMPPPTAPRLLLQRIWCARCCACSTPARPASRCPWTAALRPLPRWAGPAALSSPPSEWELLPCGWEGRRCWWRVSGVCGCRACGCCFAAFDNMRPTPMWSCKPFPAPPASLLCS